jgi:hypothetical protein
VNGANIINMRKARWRKKLMTHCAIMHRVTAWLRNNKQYTIASAKA